jgi:ActR/RegA family two-component response regulator
MGDCDSVQKLLVVDDDPLAARAMARLLRPDAVDVGADVTTALRAFDSGAHDGAFVEIRLGKGAQREGLDVVRALRSCDLDTAIVIVTAWPYPELAEDAMHAGADGVLFKVNVTRSRLRRALADARSRSGGSPPLDSAEQVDADPTSLEEVIEEALDSDASDVVEATCRRVAVAMAASRNPDRHAFPQAARALGIRANTLSAYRVIGLRFSPEEIAQLLSYRRNSRGQRISPSHLEQFARLPKAVSNGVIDRTFAESLSVRRVRAIVQGVVAGVGQLEPPSAP